jgi:hypothetical protein
MSRLVVVGCLVDALGVTDPLVLYWNRDRSHTSLAQYVIAPTGD